MVSSPAGEAVTPVEYAVRLVNPDEYAAVAALTVGVYVDEGYAEGGYVEVLRDVAGRARAADILVAVDPAGVVHGAVTLAHGGRDYAEQAVAGEAVVRMLVVAPGARGSGVGTALMRSCLDRARAAGCTRVLLSTQAGMRAAHHVYGRLGFRREPANDWSPEPGVELMGYVLTL